MKFSCIRSYFLDSVAAAERVIEKSTTLPILQYVLIQAEKGKIVLSATNLEIGIHVSFQAKVDEEGSFVLPAKTLLGFLTYLTTEKIMLQTKGTTLTIDAGSHKADIKGLDVKDFPIIPSVADDFEISLSAVEFLQALSSVVFLSSSGEIRPELAGVFCSFEKEQLRMAATDSFRLGERILKIPVSKKEIQCIIPTRTVNEAIRLFSGSGNVVVRISTNQILFKNPEREMISRLIEGKYPDYTAVIPTSFTTRIYLKKEEYSQALRAASIFSGKTYEIKIHIVPEKKKFTIESRNADVGEHVSDISCEGKGKELSLAVNYHYMLDALGKIDDETVSLEGNTETDPILLKGSVSKGTQYIVMPLRSY